MYNKICPICETKFKGHRDKVYCTPECRKSIFTRECKTCGKPFTASQKSRKHYCSFECRREGKSKICPTCKKLFFGNTKYCSKECLKPKEYTKCLLCNKTFKKVNHCHKFCTVKHRTQYKNMHKKIEKVRRK